MELLRFSLVAPLLTVLLSDCSSPSTTPFAPAPVPLGATRELRAALGPRSILASAPGSTRTLCTPSADPTRAACLASVRVANAATPPFADAVYGLTPNDLSTVYAYPAPAAQPASKATVAIVVAYDAPAAESDLAIYRAHFALPACSSANGCFRKVSALPALLGGGLLSPLSITAHPTASLSGWSAETEADLEAASAVCTHCKLLLVEAASDGLADLGNAVLTAALLGASVVDASFGAPESPNQLSLVPSFAPGSVKVVAAAGDSGRGLLFPAASGSVIAVAGTTLSVTGTTLRESLWAASGGGCSAVFARPSVQPAWCPNRSVADVAAIADPATGLAFYDASLGGWNISGGTSIASPVVAAMFAMSNDTVSGYGPQQLYARASSYAPVGGAGTVAGLGVPIGLAAF